MDALKDGSHLYQVERRAEHAARPRFCITELQIPPKHQAPWHLHTQVQDTFYVTDAHLRLFLREPKEEVRLGPGESYSVRPGRLHLVTNGGEASATFLVLQGIGEYDFVRWSDSDPGLREPMPAPASTPAAFAANHAVPL